MNGPSCLPQNLKDPADPLFSSAQWLKFHSSARKYECQTVQGEKRYSWYSSYRTSVHKYSQKRKSYDSHVISIIMSSFFDLVCLYTSVKCIFMYFLHLYPRCQYLQRFSSASMLVHRVLFLD